MKKSRIFRIIVILAFLWFVYSCYQGCGFGPEYDSAIIKQKVGGVLVCNSTYTADIHDWQYDVSYMYINGHDTSNIGSGTYFIREWPKNEQLTNYKDWLILKTGGWLETEKILVGNKKSKNWIGYEFSPDSIENGNAWKKSKIPSLLNWCCAQTKIESIINGQIVVSYKFRTHKTMVEKYDTKYIHYHIDDSTGRPIMDYVQQ